MRQAPASFSGVHVGAAPEHPFSEWNLVQYYTGKQVKCGVYFTIDLYFTFQSHVVVAVVVVCVMQECVSLTIID